METPNCKKCRYRIHLANLCDIHVDHHDCDKVGTEFCEKMNDPEFIDFMEGRAEDGKCKTADSVAR